MNSITELTEVYGCITAAREWVNEGKTLEAAQCLDEAEGWLREYAPAEMARVDAFLAEQKAKKPNETPPQNPA